MLSKHTVLLLTVLVNVGCEKLFFYEDSIGTLDESKFEKVKDKSKVEFLDLRGTEIVRILDTAFQGLDNLNVLAIGQNHLECLPENVFHGIQNVEHMEMSSNKLRYLHKNTFSKQRKLLRLNLANNLMIKLEVGLFDDTIALVSLNLQDNKLVYIPEGIFNKLNNLKSLDLGANYIHYIERNSMPSAVPTSLKFLWLWTNRLQSLDLYDSTLNSLVSVNFHKNPFYCDCNLKRTFKKWKSNFSGWEATCEGPEHLKNRRWSTLQESDLTCDRNVVKFNLESSKFPRVGENVVLECYINLPVGDITITYKNGTNVVDHLRRRQRFPTIQADSSKEHSLYKLTIKEVLAQDTGPYMCVINGKVGREFYLIVDEPSYYEKCITNEY